MHTAIRNAVAALILFLSLSPALTAAPFTGIVVLGDSLSDGGNAFLATGTTTTPPYPLIPDAPYPRGLLLPALSNGPIWAEHLGAALGLPVLPSLAGGTNFAFGGADTGALPSVPPGVSPPLTDQLGMYLAGAVDPLALHAVWGGGNDLRRALDVYEATLIATSGDSAAALAAASAVVTAGVANLAGILATLAGSGVQHILSINAPDIGLAPAIDFAPPGTAALATGLSAAFNAGLAAAIAGIEATFLTDIIEVDIFSLLNAIVASPGTYGLTDATTTCLVPTTALLCSDPDTYLFWDGIHPTSAGHRLIAGAVFAAAVPAPGTTALFVLGLILLSLAAPIRRGTK